VPCGRDRPRVVHDAPRPRACRASRARGADHPTLSPKSILDRALVEANAGEYLYMAAIQFIQRVKSGAFMEHSPILFDITAVPNWAKVNFGLHKMYVAEGASAGACARVG
jgi:hypothetical protein